MPLLITYSKDMVFQKLYILNKRIFGIQMNMNNADAMAEGWYSFFEDMTITFAMFKESLITPFAYGNLFTMFIHEWIHDFSFNQTEFFSDGRIDRLINNDTFKLIKKMWTDNFDSKLNLQSFLREFIGDYLGIFCIEKELDNIQNLNDKYTFIQYSYNWVCNRYPESYIETAHPHHSLRLNVLLLSKKIQKFLIDYQKIQNVSKIKVHKPYENPACNDINIDKFNTDNDNIKNEIDASIKKYKNLPLKHNPSLTELEKINNEYKTKTLDEHNKQIKSKIDEMNKYDSYMKKYLKYKQKYLQLKNNLS
jgi:hypothetical protein